MQPNRLKAALAQGKVQAGSILGQFRSPEIIRIYKAAGFDWVFVDTEHGGFDLETVQDVCRIAGLLGLTPLVRVADVQYSLIARVLDCGAEGVIFPRVESPELLERAVTWTKFPPEGTRGFGLTRMAVAYANATMPEIMQYANENVMTVLQIETVRALEAREELLSIDGIDAVIVGPADLSVSLGVPGEFEHPKLISAVESIMETCSRRNVVPGIHLRAPKLAADWRARGMRLLSCATEATMLLEKATEVVAQISEPVAAIKRSGTD
jgi:2-dehydro-3-deoxyglucarate aldolase/4-hydroxy-2-oxoheptanedioate aldolase